MIIRGMDDKVILCWISLKCYCLILAACYNIHKLRSNEKKRDYHT